MTAKRKIICAILLLGFIQSNLQGFAQGDVIRKLQKEFEQFSTRSLAEKLYVHTDKNFYTDGEILWFKIYSVDGIFNKPLDLSKAVYVEILDREHKAILQGKVPMNDGTGSGSFIIPASVASGNYLFRAYTNWMKNKGPDFFFTKSLTIVNSLKKPDWAAIKKTGSGYDVQFLPEGGQLINGIESRIGFKAIDKNGKGINCRGYILDQKNDTVAYFKTLRFGMGRFSFLPIEGNSYKAYIQLENGTVLSYDLPGAISSGFVMKCDDDNNQLLLTVTSRGQPENSNVYLLIHTRKVLKAIRSGKISNGRTEFVIDKDIPGDGISDVIIFNDALQPVCERLYFKRPDHKLEITLNAGKDEFEKRSQVNLQIFAADQSQKPVMADLSLSAYRLDSVQTFDEDDIRSYLWLSSDLTGYVEKPGYYFSSTERETAEAADNLMITQGWRKFNLNDVQQDKKFLPEFIPETDGVYAMGRMVDKRSGTPVPGMPAYFSVPGQHYFVSAAVSGENGELNFNVNNVYGANEVVVQPGSANDSNYRVDMINPFTRQYADRIVPAFSIPENFVSQLLTHTAGTQIQNAFLNKEQQRYAMTSFFDSTAFFGKPDKKYFLDDYTRFTTMEEVIREYVPEVKLRKKEGEFHYSVKNLPYLSFFDIDPLILLDGVPVLKADRLTSFDPLKLKKMEIVTHTFYTGPVAHAGIVSYSTYDGTLGGFTLPSNAMVSDYPGFLYERSFYSPVYETKQELQSRLPDFRNVLDWDAEIKTNGDGKHATSFYTSDLPGKYVIVAEGISKNGLCGRSSAVITVKK